MLTLALLMFVVQAGGPGMVGLSGAQAQRAAVVTPAPAQRAAIVTPAPAQRAAVVTLAPAQRAAVVTPAPAQRAAMVTPAPAIDPDPPTPAELRERLVRPGLMEGSLAFRARESGALILPAGSRSPGLAFAASAILPGAGQVYNRQWIKAGVAVAIEAALVTTYSMRRSNGLDDEVAVESFAHSQWSPARYATWLNDYVDFLTTDFGHIVTASPAEIPSGINFSNPAGWSDAQAEIVTLFFTQIRAIERQVYHPETGATFSHQLPFFGEQQFYELIGKYFQFAPGWHDYPDWLDSEGDFTVAIDPEHTGPEGSKPNVSATFRQYAQDHAGAQDLLRSARQISMLFIVNHLIAGIDAAVSAKLHNDRLSTRAGLAFGPDGETVPVAAIAYRF